MSRILHTLRAVARHEYERKSFCELGVVTSLFDAADDAHSASVKLKDSGLVLPRVPVASAITGGAALPRIGDVVVVLFARGDLSSPLIIAQVYSDVRRPPQFDRDQLVLSWPGDADGDEAKVVRVEVGASDDKRELNVVLGGDLDARVSISDGVIELTSGGVSFKLEHASSSDAKASLTAGGTKIEVAQDGDLTLESAGKLTLKAREVVIEGDTKVKVGGQIVEIN